MRKHFTLARIIHGHLYEMTQCRRASGVSRMVYFLLSQNHPAYRSEEHTSELQSPC